MRSYTELNSKTTNTSDDQNGLVQEKHAEGLNLTIHGLDGLRPVIRTFQFTLDFNVFNSLVESTYHHISMVNREYSENISMGMFSYYCGMALWYRLYAIRHAQGGDRAWWFSSLEVAVDHGFVLPKSISVLLDSIGDFIEPNHNVYWKFVFPALNRAGHFGKMSADSFYKYMAYPAPAILVETLRRELDLIDGKIEPFSEWRLDGINVENIPKGRMFTKNVCGYYVPPYASIYNMKADGQIHKQLCQTFANAPVPETPENLDGVLVYMNLIAFISNFNSNNILKYHVEKYSNGSKYGSTAQMGFVESSTTNGEDCGEYFSSDVQGFSPVVLPTPAANLIPVLRLRARRASRIGAYPYDFKTVEDIPAGWPDKLNSCFDFGDARNCWNCGKFSTGSIDSNRAISEYVASFAKTD